MIPPFVACMVLVALLSFLRLHVLAREGIFVDLSLAPMAALGGLSALRVPLRPAAPLPDDLVPPRRGRAAGMEDPLVGLSVLPVVRRRYHAGRTRGGRVDGVQLPRRAGGHRVPLHA